VTADAKSRAYGDANPALTYQVGGSGLAMATRCRVRWRRRRRQPAMSATYGITRERWRPRANYALNYASANLTVTPRAITVTADAKSRAYGDANPALTYQVGGSGLVNGDSLSGRSRRRRPASKFGVYGINQGDAGGLGQLRAKLCER
jgi:hypothetical protein